MSAKKTNNAKDIVDSNLKHFKFSKKNYTLLLIGLGINLLGFLLMIGGGSNDPNIFNEKELFSFQRITLSPYLIMIGYVVMGYAIMKNPYKEDKKENQ